MKFKEAQLKDFASPLSQSEEQRCKNAINMVRDAMKLVGYSDNNNIVGLFEKDTFSYSIEMKNSEYKRVKLLVQGSYANNTNVKLESDVDVAIILESTFLPLYRYGVSGKNYGFTEDTYNLLEFKNDVESALKKKFSSQVKRGNKSIKVYGNSYRVDADVVPCQRLRDYRNDFSNNEKNYIPGIEIHPDSGGRIRNFPEQHIVNGKAKNNKTNYYFKKHIRIAKKIKSLMESENISSAKNVSSFAIESLFWNIPDDVYGKYSTLRYTFDELITYLDSKSYLISGFKEINGIKSLQDDDPLAVQKYTEFIKDIKRFFDYDIKELL